jgi:hypothetical protein
MQQFYNVHITIKKLDSILATIYLPHLFRLLEDHSGDVPDRLPCRFTLFFCNICSNTIGIHQALYRLPSTILSSLSLVQKRALLFVRRQAPLRDKVYPFDVWLCLTGPCYSKLEHNIFGLH